MARVYVTVQIILLVAMTAFFVLGVLGTVGKLLFDDWRVRQSTRLPVPVVAVPARPIERGLIQPRKGGPMAPPIGGHGRTRLTGDFSATGEEKTTDEQAS